jgi:hypothetical protein
MKSGGKEVSVSPILDVMICGSGLECDYDCVE